MSLLTIDIYAMSSDYYFVSLTKMSVSFVPIHVDDTPRGNRTPSHPIECIINNESIYIPSLNISDIILFEIYDTNKNRIGSFSEADEFIAFLFSYHGDVEIQIYTVEYILCGHLSL